MALVLVVMGMGAYIVAPVPDDPTVQADENGAPGAWAFTIFDYNWWMVKQSCPEYTPAGYTTSSNEAQIPPEIFDILKDPPPPPVHPFVLSSSDTPFLFLLFLCSC